MMSSQRRREFTGAMPHVTEGDLTASEPFPSEFSMCSVWYKWTPPVTVEATYALTVPDRSQRYTELAIYTGSSQAALTAAGLPV